MIRSRTEIQRLANMIRRMDDEVPTQRKEYDQVINERDIRGTQLIRRNDELALLYEKLKIHMSTLRTGEAQYAQRLQDVRVLRLTIKDLQCELGTHNSGRLVDDMKRELFNAQRGPLQEKAKVKALSEELENSMNVHRWRKLKGPDPATCEMTQRIQRLIAKTEGGVEKEELYVEPKNLLARRSGGAAARLPELAAEQDAADEAHAARAQHVPGAGGRVQARDRAPHAGAAGREAQVLRAEAPRAAGRRHGPRGQVARQGAGAAAARGGAGRDHAIRRRGLRHPVIGWRSFGDVLVRASVGRAPLRHRQKRHAHGRRRREGGRERGQ